MNVHQTHLGFWQADFASAPRRRTRAEAQADADLLDPPQPIRASKDWPVIVAAAIALLALVFVLAFLGGTSI